ncbi:MAG TPA: hypothetical protein VES40_16610 [Ilumatobacteraceae bacterium]|nr:hypothetical protein [Ilumatobacteraceae bacterium]
MTAHEFDAHLDHDHIAAVFADRSAAENAVARLRALGFGSDHLGVVVHDDNPVDFEHDADAEMMHDAKVGIEAGAPLGALAGLGIAALAATGVGGVIGVGGMLAFAGASALWGAMLGGYLGTAVGSVGWDEHEDFGYVPLEPGEVLLVVCSHGEPDVVRDALINNGGRLTTTDKMSS